MARRRTRGRGRKGITPQNETNNTEKAYEMALERNVAGEWAQYEQKEGGRMKEGKKRLGHIVAIAHDVSVPLYPPLAALLRQLVNGNEDVCGESEVATGSGN